MWASVGATVYVWAVWAFVWMLAWTLGRTPAWCAVARQCAVDVGIADWTPAWTLRGRSTGCSCGRCVDNVDIRMDSRVDVGEDARVVCGGAFARRGRWSCRADARVDVARTFQWTFVWALR